MASRVFRNIETRTYWLVEDEHEDMRNVGKHTMKNFGRLSLTELAVNMQKRYWLSIDRNYAETV